MCHYYPRFNWQHQGKRLSLHIYGAHLWNFLPVELRTVPFMLPCQQSQNIFILSPPICIVYGFSSGIFVSVHPFVFG